MATPEAGRRLKTDDEEVMAYASEQTAQFRGWSDGLEVLYWDSDYDKWEDGLISRLRPTGLWPVFTGTALDPCSEPWFFMVLQGLEGTSIKDDTWNDQIRRDVLFHERRSRLVGEMKRLVSPTLGDLLLLIESSPAISFQLRISLRYYRRLHHSRKAEGTQRLSVGNGNQ